MQEKLEKIVFNREQPLTMQLVYDSSYFWGVHENTKNWLPKHTLKIIIGKPNNFVLTFSF